MACGIARRIRGTRSGCHGPYGRRANDVKGSVQRQLSSQVWLGERSNSTKRGIGAALTIAWGARTTAWPRFAFGSLTRFCIALTVSVADCSTAVRIGAKLGPDLLKPDMSAFCAWGSMAAVTCTAANQLSPYVSMPFASMAGIASDAAPLTSLSWR
ncbi:hypothetical protein BN2475_70005 [Paraburkholderia ribeironis]|uniref:Uncharacterized protein n=1 Tax=Paraburkholderia ribeironis TaxID=1247936 RepID=A0A1N7RLH2_9BURK|nr:hypothetical protein BN2475_70005 [Paraburkholderia ribeironis]